MQFGADAFSKTTTDSTASPYVTTKEITLDGITYPANTQLPLTKFTLNRIQDDFGLDAVRAYDTETKRTSVMIEIDPNSPLAKQKGTRFLEAMQIGDQINIQGTDKKFDTPVTAATAGNFYVVPDTNRSTAQEKSINEKAGSMAILYATASRMNEDLPEETGMTDYIMNSYTSLPSLDQIYDNKTPLQLAEMDKAFKEVDFNTTLDIAKSVKEGTGVFQQLGARISTLGGALGVDFLQNIGKTQADAKAELQLLQTLGAAALADSPRFAVTDINLKRQLFTDPDAFFQDPDKEYRKMQNLKGYLETELVALGNDLRMARADTDVRQLKAKIGAAKSALSMMRTVKSIQPKQRVKASGKGALTNL